MPSLSQLLLPLLATVTSLLGAWLASSIMAALKMPFALVIFSGLLMLPILPVLWVISQQRFSWKYRLPFLIRRISRLVLILNLGLLAVLLTLYPHLTFTSLRQHGDGLLGDLQGKEIQAVRTALRRSASGTASQLEQVHAAAADTIGQYVESASSNSVGISLPQMPQPQPPKAAALNQWPWRSDLHPAIRSMPAQAETSIASVANYIAAQEANPMQRIKALHDYVATRIEYDAPAFLSGQISDQSPDRIFTTHKAVCQGYADLLTALGQAIGEDIVTISGYARTPFSTIREGNPNHAWNAVNLSGRWYLLDATWDSGHLNESGKWVQQYRTAYLMPPPDVLIYDHLPVESDWQMLQSPLTLTEFEQQPDLKPQFFAAGLRLVEPTHYRTEVNGMAKIQLQNREQQWILADYVEKNGSRTGECISGEPTRGKEISCRFPASGLYEVNLYSSETKYGKNYESVGKLEFNNRS